MPRASAMIALASAPSHTSLAPGQIELGVANLAPAQGKDLATPAAGEQ